MSGGYCYDERAGSVLNCLGWMVDVHRSEGCCRRGIPDPHRTVAAAAGQQGAAFVGESAQRSDRGGVAFKDGDPGPGSRVPDPHLAIALAAGQQGAAIVGESAQGLDRAGVAFKDGEPVPVAASQIRTLPSPSPLASTARPSWVKAHKDLTALVWPSRTVSPVPVAASQIRTMRSPSPLASTVRPSWVKVHTDRPRWCGPQGR